MPEAASGAPAPDPIDRDTPPVRRDDGPDAGAPALALPAEIRDEGGDPERKRRRRGSRGGRGRGRADTDGREGTPGDSAEGGAAAARGGAPRRAAGAGARPADRRPDDLPDPPGEGRPPTAESADRAPRRPRIGDSRPAPEPAEESPAPGGRRRRRRGGRGRSGGQRSTPVEALVGESHALDDETFEKRRGRERKGRPIGRYLMCVDVRDGATQIAVIEGRALIEHYVSRPQDGASQIHGNIYLGKVQNVLPGMEAAFVDIGTPKNAVLYRGDVQFDPDDIEHKGQTRIEHILKARQNIVSQVTKNPIGTKGARLTQEVSLPGRFVVLIPNSTTYGISKRLGDDERKRLRSILDTVKPAHHGLIVRTAAEGATREELGRDVARLLQQWEQIDGLAKRSSSPTLLYREPDMAVRIIREEFNNDFRGVVIDDRALYEEVRDYVASITPELADRVEYYDTEEEGLPLFEHHHVHEQLHKALDRKVWLPSGGSLIIERTEALTVIDVNTGKNVGTSNLEETVFRNNVEAADEVARQLRLRDIGGIIVIDFIDMEVRSNRDEVMRVFRDALARDKTRTQVFEISELGLVEMTRKRIGEGLLESFTDVCPQCLGRGILFDDSLL